MPGAPTLTDAYRHILIEGDAYDDSLGASDPIEIYVHFQRSATGDFTGEEETIEIAPSRKQVADERGTDAWTTPYPRLERMSLLNPGTATYHIRYRYERWQNGVTASVGAWSTSASIAIVAPAGEGDRFEGPWTTDEIESRVFVTAFIGQTKTGEDSVEQLLISDNNLSGSWAQIKSQFLALRAKIPGLGLLIRGWSGNFAAYTGDPDFDMSPIRYAIGPRRAGGQTTHVETSFAGAYDIKQAGIDLGGTQGGQMETLFDEFLGPDGPASLTAQGIPVILYGFGPFNALTEHKTSDLPDYARLGLTMAAGCHAAFDSWGRVAATDDFLSEDSAPTKVMKWRDSAHPFADIWQEVTMIDAADAAAWHGAYPRLHSIHLMDHYFDSYAGVGTLALQTDRVPMASYPDVWHMIWTDASSCAYSGAGETPAEDMANQVEAALDVLGHHERSVASLGSLPFVYNNLTQAQGNALASAGAIVGGAGGGAGAQIARVARLGRLVRH